jgi:protein-L-isoaspartate(D-aspartate) O-methyltransferase
VEGYGHERAALVERLRRNGAVTSPDVERAFARVPRHSFLPTTRGDIAYEDRAVLVKHDADGRPISSASQPSMMAQMLEQLRAELGGHILEVGTGTGYNAALLAEIVGPSGSVVSVEIESDLAERAGQILAGVGYANVDVVVGDGSLGYPSRGPFDRIIVTAGAPTVADAWRTQLADGGRLVVPIVNAAGIGRSVLFEKIDGTMRRGDERPCGFLALRHP